MTYINERKDCLTTEIAAIDLFYTYWVKLGRFLDSCATRIKSRIRFGHKLNPSHPADDNFYELLWLCLKNRLTCSNNASIIRDYKEDISRKKSDLNAWINNLCVNGEQLTTTNIKTLNEQFCQKISSFGENKCSLSLKDQNQIFESAAWEVWIKLHPGRILGEVLKITVDFMRL